MNTTVPAIGSHQISFASIATTTRNWPVEAHLSLQVREEKGGFDSHSFNVTSRDVPPKTLMATASSSSSALLIPASMLASASTELPTNSPAMPTGRGGKNSTHTLHGHHGFSREDDRRSHHHHASGLSSGAVAGITIGVIAGGIAMLMPAVCFHLRRRRSKRELAIQEAEERPNLPPAVPPEVLPSSDLQHDLPVSSHGSNMRKPSNASTTTILVGLAPSRRPTETSFSLASPSTPTIHELYASGQMINEMPATPLKTPSEINPLQSRPQPSHTILTTYRLLTPLALIFALIPAIHYTITSPRAGAHPSHRTIWHQNSAHPTPFALFSPLIATYWLVIYLLQAAYCTQLFPRLRSHSFRSSSRPNHDSNSSPNHNHNHEPNSNAYSHDDSATTEIPAATIGLAPHVIAHLLLHLVFVHLWCRGLLAIAEVALMLDFANLGVGYARFPFRVRGLGRAEGGAGDDGDGGGGGWRALLVHAAALAVPLAWVFVALFWCGAAMLGAHSVGARLFANVAVWLWLVFGVFFVIGYRDYVLGFSLSVLSAALGVQQILIRVLALQWIFAFVVTGLLFVASLAVAGFDIAAVTRKTTNGETNGHHITGETAPLLRDGNADA
ncbi:MAG: hypothetical protein Q9165_005303 [Trypethelium subeluteriae]